MGFPTVDRYANVIKNIISGSFYESNGVVVPVRDGPTVFRLETDQANTEFGIYINEVFSGVEVSDSQGNVVLSRELPLGENEITILSRADGRSTRAFVTVREYALWLASYAESLETIDDNIIVLNNNEVGVPSQNAGIEVERGTSTNVQLRWNETSDTWQLFSKYLVKLLVLMQI